jgi:hypothetical protein
VVIYKSKVQLQELFSRKGDHKDRRRREASVDRLGRQDAGGMAGPSGTVGVDSGRGEAMLAGSSSGAGTMCKKTSLVQPQPQRVPLLPRGPFVMSHPDLTLMGETKGSQGGGGGGGGGKGVMMIIMTTTTMTTSTTMMMMMLTTTIMMMIKTTIMMMMMCRLCVHVHCTTGGGTDVTRGEGGGVSQRFVGHGV